MKLKQLSKLFDTLTIEEKIGQLIQLSGEFYNSSDISLGPQRELGIDQQTINLSGSVMNVTGAENIRKIQEQHLRNSNHAIPLLFMSDIIYGYRTVYPIPLGIGASWDPELIKKAYAATAEETYASGMHVSFAPMVDLVHDPRWGRVLESTGEDPYLNSQYAKAMVEGFQKNLKEGKGIAACVKHFAAYGAVESGREYNSVDMSLQNLYQNYLPAYKAALKAGAKMVMTSLSTLNGVPSTADKWLLQDVLRDKWGFDGVIISDYASIYELIQHGFAKDKNDAAKKAIEAGVDIDMKSPCYATGLHALLKDGRLDEGKINAAAWRVLLLKNDLGLFEDPYRGASEQSERQQILSPEHRHLARQVSREAMVLLKNENDILPLSEERQDKVALIGPYAEAKNLLGMWAVHGHPSDTVTIADGLKKILNNNLKVASGTKMIKESDVPYGVGENIPEENQQVQKARFEEALEVANESDIIIFAGGESVAQSGEAGSRTKLSLPKEQKQLFNELCKLNKPIITIIISGRPLILKDIEERSSALLQARFPGTEGGHAIADVVFGKYNPSGRLSMSMPYNEGQLPIYYNHLSTGRPVGNSQHRGRFLSKYIDAPIKPLHPFGYGLSYGKVRYSKLHLNQPSLTKDSSLTGTIEISNLGGFDRTETIQIYIQDIVASVVQPVRRLIDFKRIYLKAGEQTTVKFEIKAKQLGFYNQLGDFIIEPGQFNLYIGDSSDSTCQTSFDLIEE
ncbi:beta-glucosidase BglX [Pediococcus acidilactici]